MKLVDLSKVKTAARARACGFDFLRPNPRGAPLCNASRRDWLPKFLVASCGDAQILPRDIVTHMTEQILNRSISNYYHPL